MKNLKNLKNLKGNHRDVVIAKHILYLSKGINNIHNFRIYAMLYIVVEIMIIYNKYVIDQYY